MVEPKQIELTEMLNRLHEFHAQHPDTDVVGWMKRRIANPLGPQTQDGRLRPHPLILVLGTTGLLLFASFIYFSYFLP